MKKWYLLLSIFSTLIVGCSKDDYLEDDSTGLPTPKANEIYYTTTDGLFIDFSDKSWFNTSVTSHTVKNDSIFVLTFIKDLKEIEYKQFYEEDKLKSIKLPEGILKIGDDAFYDCKNLTTFTIPNSLINIDSNPFFGCKMLKEFNGKYASSDKKCIVIDGEIISFAPYGITDYTIPKGVTSIGNAFVSCHNIESITVPKGVTRIGSFIHCYSLTKITLGEDVTSVDDFIDTNLKYIFCKCINPPKIENKYAFMDTGATKEIYVPAESVEKYKSAEVWKDYAAYIFADPTEN